MSILVKLGERHKGVPEIKDYLLRYGYKQVCSCHYDVLCQCCADGMRKLQHVGKCRETGNFDTSALRLMSRARCGNPDFPVSTGIMAKVSSGYKWQKPILSWSMLGLTNDITGRQEMRSFKDALKVWEKALEGKLKFVYFTRASLRKAVEADIVGTFGIKVHIAPDPQKQNCPYSFDGELAHAFYPLAGMTGYEYLAGNVHMDDNWNWSAKGNPPGGYSAFGVFIHEAGHSLGLAHDTEHESSIMYPFYNGKEELSNWDIQAIMELYP